MSAQFKFRDFLFPFLFLCLAFWNWDAGTTLPPKRLISYNRISSLRFPLHRKFAGACNFSTSDIVLPNQKLCPCSLYATWTWSKCRECLLMLRVIKFKSMGVSDKCAKFLKLNNLVPMEIPPSATTGINTPAVLIICCHHFDACLKHQYSWIRKY